jgi:hypothetical protein
MTTMTSKMSRHFIIIITSDESKFRYHGEIQVRHTLISLDNSVRIAEVERAIGTPGLQAQES